MNRNLLVTTATFLVGAVCIGIWGVSPERGRAEGVDKPQIEKDVLAQLGEIQKAGEGLDADKVFNYVLENNKGVLVQDGRLYLSRQEALESTRRGFAALKSVQYRFSDQHVTLLSPTIALVVQQGSVAATLGDGRSISRPFIQTVVMVSTNGQWKVYHAHRSSAAEAGQ